MMSKKVKYICDACERDITYSQGGYEHSLILYDRKYGPDSNIIITYYMYPLLDEEKIFCGFGCLKKWLGEKNDKRD